MVTNADDTVYIPNTHIQIWLNPRDLPKRAALDCAGCGEPLAFILQIYCPLDDPPGAFHRALYIFCCRKPRCTGPGWCVQRAV